MLEYMLVENQKVLVTSQQIRENTTDVRHSSVLMLFLFLNTSFEAIPFYRNKNIAGV